MAQKLTKDANKLWLLLGYTSELHSFHRYSNPNRQIVTPFKRMYNTNMLINTDWKTNMQDWLGFTALPFLMSRTVTFPSCNWRAGVSKGVAGFVQIGNPLFQRNNWCPCCLPDEWAGHQLPQFAFRLFLFSLSRSKVKVTSQINSLKQSTQPLQLCTMLTVF